MQRHSRSRIEYMVKARSNFKRKSTANNVDIIISVPSDADSPHFKTSTGNANYVPDKEAIVWSIKHFQVGLCHHRHLHLHLHRPIPIPITAAISISIILSSNPHQGQKEYLMRAEFGLPSVRAEEEIENRAPIRVEFEIPYFTVSGIQVC